MLWKLNVRQKSTIWEYFFGQKFLFIVSLSWNNQCFGAESPVSSILSPSGDLSRSLAAENVLTWKSFTLVAWICELDPGGMTSRISEDRLSLLLEVLRRLSRTME